MFGITKWLKAVFSSEIRWSPALVEKRLRPLRFRVAQEADFPFCESLHRENEAFGVPTNHRPYYAEALRSGKMLTLIVEESGMPIATCGMQWAREGLIWLTYGLVHPSRHRCGVGTTMLVARLALMPTGQSEQQVAISAVETSLPFYRRFGFYLIGRFDAEDGRRYPTAFLDGVTSRVIEDCRAMLARAGATIPEVEIPVEVPDDSNPAPVIGGSVLFGAPRN